MTVFFLDQHGLFLWKDGESRVLRIGQMEMEMEMGMGKRYMGTDRAKQGQRYGR
jgi:hypothetical protein